MSSILLRPIDTRAPALFENLIPMLHDSMPARHAPSHQARPAIALLLAAAAVMMATTTAQASPEATEPTGESLIDSRSQEVLSPADLLTLMRQSDFVLLGEVHDNPLHHQRRGALLAQLRAPAVAVAEHLPAPAQLQLRPELDLLSQLSGAGFEAKAWRWPLHEALFEGLRASGMTLLGGNVATPLARQVAREGRDALPDFARAQMDATPLSAPGRAALAADLVQGHCGQLSGPRLEGMIWAQGLRDASLWSTMKAAAKAGAKPVLLLAGNGHIRSDYGLAYWIQQQAPKARVISVGFAEIGQPTAGLYTHVWRTPAATRDDPCAGFKMPPATP
ncbi:ChaN family lipoprotein [Paucibacter sp. KCTC 42545]|uniref:ChaN family lipoprotein n=1 Tax=Paucibacter sp. KCTC 42545 TaxID=1768242 RepID=UPI0009EC81F7|nr:ChaN family lipoprotein [Paucibacter sp. KCTC 42545]